MRGHAWRDPEGKRSHNLLGQNSVDSFHFVLLQLVATSKHQHGECGNSLTAERRDACQCSFKDALARWALEFTPTSCRCREADETFSPVLLLYETS